jgi:protein-tyrosine kinase
MASATPIAADVVGEPGERPLPGAAGLDVSFSYELSPDLVTLSDTRLAEAEAIRTARTHIIARHLQDGRRGLALCAPAAGVGCTFSAVNLAVALSQVGIATLLIDADMRAPQVESFINPGRSTAGLRQCLAADNMRPGDYVHHEVLSNLSIMYAGGVALNAQELLAGENFRKLIERCLRDFECTIIDTPPADELSDALRIGAVIVYTVLVARANSSRSSAISLLAQKLQEDGAEVVGTILNEI